MDEADDSGFFSSLRVCMVSYRSTPNMLIDHCGRKTEIQLQRAQNVFCILFRWNGMECYIFMARSISLAPIPSSPKYDIPTQ